MKPPVAKYRYTLTIRANSHDEILDELLLAVNGGYLLDSEYYSRDEFDVTDGRTKSVLEHRNPEMTSEKYLDDLNDWRNERKKGEAE